jgi:hypothetical protein
METNSGLKRFNWRLPFCTAAVTLAICLLDALAETDGILYLLLLLSISLLFVSSLVIFAIMKRARLCLALMSMLAAFWLTSFVMVKNRYAIRNNARWSLRSHRYKAEVLARPETANGELKHVEWDGWGFPGAGDTTVYLVFDPANSLATAAKSHHPGQFSGIPCKVPLVSSLESRWYAVLFYTDERWGKAHFDCGVADYPLPSMLPASR